MAKPKKVKLPFGIDEAFISEVSLLDATNKKLLMARIESGKQEAKQFMTENETIVALRENLREAEGPARDTVKAANNKLKYINEELKKQGEF